MYCVYLTLYFGNMLPRRYIGSCKLEKIKNGYNGSVSSKKYKKIYEEEQRNNKHLFKTRVLSVHETGVEAREKELDLHINYDVVLSEKYFNESLAQPKGFFGRGVSGENNPMYGRSRKGEKHKGGENISKSLREFFKSDKGLEEREKRSKRLAGENNPMYGKTHTEEERIKRSIAYSNEGNPMYGKTHTEETRKKISDSRRGKPSPNKGKKMGEAQKEKLRKPKSESHKQKLRKTYIINEEQIIYDAKEYCEENGFNYVCFTQAAKKNKKYKGLSIKVVD